MGFGFMHSGADFALVMPIVSTVALSLFLDGFFRSFGPEDRVVLVLDHAGWHGLRVLRVTDHNTLAPQPNEMMWWTGLLPNAGDPR